MVVDVIRRRNLDRRRDEIASNARESLGRRERKYR